MHTLFKRNAHFVSRVLKACKQEAYGGVAVHRRYRFTGVLFAAP